MSFSASWKVVQLMRLEFSRITSVSVSGGSAGGHSKKDCECVSHEGRAKYCKKDSRYPPLCTKWWATSRNSFKNHFQTETPKIQVQILKPDKFQACCGRRHVSEPSCSKHKTLLFRRTIFRCFESMYMFGDKQKQAMVYFKRQPSMITGNMDGHKSQSEPWIGVTRVAAQQKLVRRICGFKSD